MMSTAEGQSSDGDEKEKYSPAKVSSSYAGNRAFGSTQLSYQIAPLVPADGALNSSLGITGIVNVMERGDTVGEDIVLDVIAVD